MRSTCTVTWFLVWMLPLLLVRSQLSTSGVGVGGGGGGGVGVSGIVDNVCANVCTCKWKGGKRTVECKPRVLSNVPDGIDPETQVLDVSDNEIGALSSKIFIKVRLTNLQRLYLRSCRISRIDQYALNGLTNLVELDLSHNRLSSVPSHSFGGVPFLRDLVLAHNPLGYVPDKAFKSTPNLVKLDLSNAELADLAPKSFQGLETLEVLKLSHNRLSTLKYPGTFEPLSKLTTIDLHENPWICDCHLREIKSYLIKQNLPTPIAPVCQRPEHLANKSFSELELDDFACPPVIQIVSRYAEATIGENASIVCQVSAIPPAKIKWIWNGKLYTNHTAVNSYQKILIQEEGLLFQKQSTLVLTNAQETDSSMFFCVAENQAGSVEANFTLHVSLRTAGMSTLGSGQIAGISAALVVLILLILLTIMILFARLRRMPPKELKAPAPAGSDGSQPAAADGCCSSTTTTTTTTNPNQEPGPNNHNPQSATSTVSRRKLDDDVLETTSFHHHHHHHHHHHETKSPVLAGSLLNHTSYAQRQPVHANHLTESSHHQQQQHDYLINRGYEDIGSAGTRLQQQQQQQQQSAMIAGPCYSSQSSLMPIDNPDLIRDTRRGSNEEAAMMPAMQYAAGGEYGRIVDESKLYTESLSWEAQAHQRELLCRPSVSVNPYLSKDLQQQQQQQAVNVVGAAGVVGLQQQGVPQQAGQQEPFPAGAKQIRVWQKGVPVLPPVSALKRVLSTRSSPDEGYQEGTGTDV